MKISEVTIEDLKAYAHVYHDEDNQLFTNILMACKSYISNYTGLPITAPLDNPDTTDIDESAVKSLDDYEELTLVMFVLSNELYDNRVFSVDGDNVNILIDSILGMHSVNLL